MRERKSIFDGVLCSPWLAMTSQKQGTSETGIAHWLLNQPFGQILTGIFALISVGFGLSQIFIGLRHKFLDKLAIPAHVQGWLTPICKFGF